MKGRKPRSYIKVNGHMTAEGADRAGFLLALAKLILAASMGTAVIFAAWPH